MALLEPMVMQERQLHLSLLLRARPDLAAEVVCFWLAPRSLL